MACKTIVKTCSFIVLCDLANLVGCAQVKVRIMICKKKKKKSYYSKFDANVYGCFWFRSQEPFLYRRSRYFVSRRIKRKQSLLPEHYLNVIFDVDGTTEDSSGRLLWVTEQYSASLSARTSARNRIASHAFSITHSIHSRIKTFLLPLKESVILKYTGWRFMWFFSLAKVAIG